MEGIKSFKLGK